MGGGEGLLGDAGGRYARPDSSYVHVRGHHTHLALPAAETSWRCIGRSFGCFMGDNAASDGVAEGREKERFCWVRVSVVSRARRPRSNSLHKNNAPGVAFAGVVRTPRCGVAAIGEEGSERVDEGGGGGWVTNACSRRSATPQKYAPA